MITEANLDAPDFAALIEDHERQMLALSSRESCHFLQLDGLRAPGIAVWEIRQEGELIGVGALKQLDASHGEIKSMHTRIDHRGHGLGQVMLEHIISVAAERGYKRLSLETGSMDGFIPARTMYERHGFTYCGPFEGYKEDPNSVFMTLEL